MAEAAVAEIALPPPKRFPLLRRLFRHRLFVTGLVLFGAMLLLALAADWIAPYAPLRMQARMRFRPPGGNFLFGTDNFGRDIFSRLCFGARLSLGIGFAVDSADLWRLREHQADTNHQNDAYESNGQLRLVLPIIEHSTDEDSHEQKIEDRPNAVVAKGNDFGPPPGHVPGKLADDACEERESQASADGTPNSVFIRGRWRHETHPDQPNAEHRQPDRKR